MMIKIKTKTNTPMVEGCYDSHVGSVKGKPNETAPRKAVLGFKVDGCEKELEKEYPFSLEEGTPLRQDLETLLGHPLTKDEINGGIDLSTLIGKPCQTVVMHKAAAGGKIVAVVGLVLPATKATPQPAVYSAPPPIPRKMNQMVS